MTDAWFYLGRGQRYFGVTQISCSYRKGGNWWKNNKVLNNEVLRFICSSWVTSDDIFVWSHSSVSFFFSGWLYSNIRKKFLWCDLRLLQTCLGKVCSQIQSIILPNICFFSLLDIVYQILVLRMCTNRTQNTSVPFLIKSQVNSHPNVTSKILNFT